MQASQETIPTIAPPNKKVRLPGVFSYQLTATDSDILLAVYSLHYLTVEQITRYIGFKQTSIVGVRKKVSKLCSLGLLRKQSLPDRAIGQKRNIFSLAARGWKYLQEQGIDVLTKQTPTEDSKEFLYLTHTLRLNDVLIGARLLEKTVPGISLDEVRHERAIKHAPTLVQYREKGKDVTGRVMPDAFLDFSLMPPFKKQSRCSIVLELDRATADASPFRKKIRKYTAFIGVPGASPYETEYGSPFITVAFLASERGLVRVKQMKHWVAMELKAMEKEHLAHLFLFSYIPPNGLVDGKTLFLSPCWHTLSSDTPISIFDT